jgi:hypothetical protein
MATLKRLESRTNDPQEGGFLATFPSGVSKVVAWRHGAPITPTVDAAKDYTARVLDALMREGRIDDADRTNWASFAAGVQRIVSDWNEALLRSLRTVGNA